jgi:imidazole glycerol-phosphate synthase subunit HisH
MITIIDYNMGNLRSVSKAIEHLGGTAQVSGLPDAIAKADKVILPGVGAFGDACEELECRNLAGPIKDFIRSGKPFLGICLGLQLLFEASEETPGVPGLGIFKGTVKLFRSQGVKVPHMGWNNSQILNPSPIVKDLRKDPTFYFVHSFYAAPEDQSLVIGQTTYGQEKFAAILGQGNTFATQFHPEKSQEDGLQILKNFIAL